MILGEICYCNEAAGKSFSAGVIANQSLVGLSGFERVFKVAETREIAWTDLAAESNTSESGEG